MDDVRFGHTVRAARIRRGWRQADLAAAAGLSDATVSRIERGFLAGMQLAGIRAVAAPLEIRVELLPRSRGADADRLLNAKHADLAEAVVTWLAGIPGWTFRPEVSYSSYGERGVIDLVGWHLEKAALLEVELKTAVIDSGEILGTIDRRLRLGPVIAASMGVVPRTVSALLVIGESASNRRRVASLGLTFAAALPDRFVPIRRYLQAPDRAIRGLMFFADRRPGQAINRFATVTRVRPHRRDLDRVKSTVGAGLDTEARPTILR